MKRSFYFQYFQDQQFQKTMTFIVGPRQVGKTTLALDIQKKEGGQGLYYNWDDWSWRKEVLKNPYGYLDKILEGKKKPLYVLDEIHKFPKWKGYLKGLWDTRGEKIKLIVTGSGRFDLYQRGGDSLLGRYHQYCLHPFSLKELIAPKAVSEVYKPEDTLEILLNASGKPAQKNIKTLDQLFTFGGFPRPFIDANPRVLKQWQMERKQRLIREDLRDISRIQSLSQVEALIELFETRVGQLFSYNSIREDLQVSLDSVRLWVKYLQQIYYHYFLTPYSKRIARALTQNPKLYLWDWSEVEEEGARFENMIASHLLKWCHFSRDWGYEALDLFYIRDKEKREVDFLITKKKKPWILIEVKLSDDKAPKTLKYFAEQLQVEHCFLVLKNLKSPGFSGDVPVLDAVSFCQSLPI